MSDGTVAKFHELYGENAFVFLDDRPWPFLVTDKFEPGVWWLCYWSDSQRKFVTLRKLKPGEDQAFRIHAMPIAEAALYAQSL
jgi:hypothetical protein